MGDKGLVQEMRNEGRKGGKLDVPFMHGPHTIVEALGKLPSRWSGTTLRTQLWVAPISPKEGVAS